MKHHFPNRSPLIRSLSHAPSYDMHIAHWDMKKINELKQMLSFKFNKKNLGVTNKILRLEIKRDWDIGKLYLSHGQYISKVLEKINIVNAKLMSTPLASYSNLNASKSSSIEAEWEAMKKIMYASPIWCSMYAMVCTGSYLAQALSMMPKYMSNPDNDH